MTEENRNKVRVLVIGCGRMGALHGQAYAKLPGFQVVGVVNRGLAKREELARELGGVLHFATTEEAIAATQPHAAAVCTYTEHHAPIGRLCLEAGLHVFMEKPLAATTRDAAELVDLAREKRRALVVGYILRHHPTWEQFIRKTQDCGKPLVMRMNLNQQSDGEMWQTHLSILRSTSPLVDVGVHYVDVMCQMAGSRPVSVHAIGARLSAQVQEGVVNYGQLQVRFEDGSIGWFESGFGPMISQSGYSIKDVFGPEGSVSLVPPPEQSGAPEAGESSNYKSHTGTGGLRIHRSELKPDGTFAQKDEWIDNPDEPSQEELCERQQSYFLQVIHDKVNLEQHWRDAVNSLRVGLAAEESVRTGQSVTLD